MKISKALVALLASTSLVSAQVSPYKMQTDVNTILQSGKPGGYSAADLRMLFSELIQTSYVSINPATGVLSYFNGSGFTPFVPPPPTGAQVTSALGYVPLAQVPPPSASVLGGIFAGSGAPHQFQTGVSTSGVPSFAQPQVADVNGAAARGANADITSLSALTTPLSPNQGGTGKSSFAVGTDYVAPTGSGAGLTGILGANVQFTQAGASVPIDLATDAKGTFRLRQFDPLACTSPAHDDAASMRLAVAAVNLAGGGRLLRPHATCYYNSISGDATYPFAAVIIPQGVIVQGEGAAGSAVVPGTAMTDMEVLTGHLSGSFDTQYANKNSYAASAIQINKPFDAIPTYVHRDYFSSFTSTTVGAVHVEGGDWEEIEKSTFIGNGLAVSFNNGGGVNSINRDNYVAGGSGFLYTNNATQPQGVEGGIVENNTVFAGNGIAIDAPQALNLRVMNNTFESSNITARFAALPVSTAHPNGTSTNNIISTGNWYGNSAAPGTSGASTLQLRGTRGFVSTGDTFAGRGNVAIDAIATASNPNNNAVFIAPSFYAPSGSAQASIDMNLSYMYGISIQSPIFSGVVDINDGGGTIGRIDGGEFNAVPTRASATFAYGKQAYGINLLASGSGSVASGATTATITHGLSYTPQLQDVTIKSTGALTGGGFYVSACNATTCTVNLPSAPSAAAPFVYTIDETR